MATKKITIGKGMKVPRGKESKMKEKAGPQCSETIWYQERSI